MSCLAMNSYTSIESKVSFENDCCPLREEDLVASARSGDSGAFEELCRRCADGVFRVAHRITRNHEDAEDVLQDSFLNAFVHIADFDGRSRFSTWLTRIAINSSLMILRERRNARTVSLDATSNDSEELTVFQELTDHARDAEEQCLQKEREAILQDAISALRPTLRSVVELGELGERSMKETAETMGMSVAAAKSRLFHARQALHKSKKLRKFYNHGPVRKEFRFGHFARIANNS